MEKVLLLHMTTLHNFCRVSFSARDEYVSLLLRCRLRPGARGIRAVIHTALQACFGAFPMRAPLHASRTERGGEEGLSALRATARAAAAPGSTWGTCPSRRSATSCVSISARCAPRIRIRGALALRRAPRGSLAIENTRGERLRDKGRRLLERCPCNRAHNRRRCPSVAVRVPPGEAVRGFKRCDVMGDAEALDCRQGPPMNPPDEPPPPPRLEDVVA